jgi:hypothetical protein
MESILTLSNIFIKPVLRPSSEEESNAYACELETEATWKIIINIS